MAFRVEYTDPMDGPTRWSAPDGTRQWDTGDDAEAAVRADGTTGVYYAITNIETGDPDRGIQL